MKTFNKSLLTILFCTLTLPLWAQEEVPMADVMRSEGKIYVVVAILLIILAGLFVYLFTMDRKITRLEKKVGSEGK